MPHLRTLVLTRLLYISPPNTTPREGSFRLDNDHAHRLVDAHWLDLDLDLDLEVLVVPGSGIWYLVSGIYLVFIWYLSGIWYAEAKARQPLVEANKRKKIFFEVGFAARPDPSPHQQLTPKPLPTQAPFALV